MAEVTFHDPAALPRERIAYVVIAARYRDKWVFCRHRNRQTWEIPGGHTEPGETPEAAARRELWEETGARMADLYPVSAYQVDGEYRCGMLFFGEIRELDTFSGDYEIEELCLLNTLPECLTYPGIQPQLFMKIRSWLCQT